MAVEQQSPSAPIGRPDSEGIRRRLDREYVVTVAPTRLDGETTPTLVERLGAQGAHLDLIVDLQAVEHCDPEVIDLLDHAAEQLAREDVSLVLSHPSPAVEAALAAADPPSAIAVRRARERRAVRRSTRGQV